MADLWRQGIAVGDNGNSDKEFLLSSLPCQMNILPWGIKFNTYGTRMQKYVYIVD